MPIDDDPRLGAYLDEWLDRHQAHVRPATLKSYRQVVRAYLRPRLGDRRLADLDTATIEALYGDLLARGGVRGKPLSVRSVRYVHAVLRRALEDALLDGLVTTNAAAEARPPRPQAVLDEVDDDLQVWTAEQARRFLDEVDDDGHHREETVAGQFGFRGELDTSVGLHLRAREYDPHTGQFTTVDPLDGLPGTSVETSPYHYANNDPINWSDPLGLTPISDAELRELFEGVGWTSTIVGALIGAGRSLAERGTSASAALRARSSHGGRVMASFRWSPRGTAIARAFRSPALRGAGRAMPFVGAGLSAFDNFVIEDQSWEIAASDVEWNEDGSRFAQDVKHGRRVVIAERTEQV